MGKPQLPKLSSEKENEEKEKDPDPVEKTMTPRTERKETSQPRAEMTKKEEMTPREKKEEMTPKVKTVMTPKVRTVVTPRVKTPMERKEEMTKSPPVRSQKV